MQVAHACLESVSSHRFRSIANNFPDLVSRLHFQVRLMGTAVLIVEFDGFPILMVPIVFSARRVLKMSVISCLTA